MIFYYKKYVFDQKQCLQKVKVHKEALNSSFRKDLSKQL